MILHDDAGDLFKSSCRTLACPINIVGVMGKGLALEFRRRVPGLYEFYLSKYPRTNRPDYRLLNHLEVFTPQTGPQILLIPTKLHWNQPSKMGWVRDNLKLISHQWEELALESLALPALGCGEGRLPFKDVRKLVLDTFAPSPLKVELYWPSKPAS